MSRRRGLAWAAAAAGLVAITAGTLVWHELTGARPGMAVRLAEWRAAHPGRAADGATSLAFDDLGAVDLDTLRTSALPWPILAASLALRESGGRPDTASWQSVRAAFRRFGFLYPDRIEGVEGGPSVSGAPLGLSLATITRTFPPLELQAVNTGCAACHAGPAYAADGMPDPRVAVPGMPNTSLDLEAFSSGSYAALKAAFRDEDDLLRAIDVLFPRMDRREWLTLRLLAMPAARRQLAERAGSYDRAMPFPNGAPGLTNGVAALKARLGVAPSDRFMPGAGFVSIPVLADRFYRSALLADGAYAPKDKPRWHAISRDEAATRDPRDLAAIASFFMVPSMGMSDVRSAAATDRLTEVLAWLRDWRPPRFPGTVDLGLAARGRGVYAAACASCHGTYDENLDQPRLISFPNWSGDVGTDRSRVEAFTPALAEAVAHTVQGRNNLDAQSTGVAAAPPLAGLWASAPYFVNGSVPTIRHLLEPETRPRRFEVGGQRLDMQRLGIAGVPGPDGSWRYAAGYLPYAGVVTIDTSAPGFSNRGHEKEVSGLTPPDRDALIEYLKLL
ncbi:MAG: cytochrome c [Rhizobiaceae bacterium]|nr:cytochrome c [Rhizobiaceae bacterium]